MSKRPRSWFYRHSLTLVSASILGGWIILYSLSSPSTHLGSFFGNAIADWTGLVVTLVATKFLYERGSKESRSPHGWLPKRWERILRDHSLSLFLIITGVGWAAAFSRMEVEGRWGQVVGNIVSEWTQVLGIVLLTKRLIETGSPESK